MRKISPTTSPRKERLLQAFGPWPAYHPDHPFLPHDLTQGRKYYALIVYDISIDGSTNHSYWTDKIASCTSLKDTSERPTVSDSLRSQIEATIVFDPDFRRAAWFHTPEDAKEAFYTRAAPRLHQVTNHPLFQQALLNNISVVEILIPATTVNNNS